MKASDHGAWRGYSIEDRDRRWKTVRENAAQAGFDCVFVPLGNRLDGRYLTQMRDAAVVLATDGRPPAVINDRGTTNDWISEARPANRAWAEPMVGALLDLGMERARIGVSGLRNGKVSHVRAYDGVINYSSYMAVTKRLPDATFEDATDVVGFARYVKSDEEIECARRASEIAVAGIDEMTIVARPGVSEAQLYARVTARMMELGGEHHNWAIKTGPLGSEAPRFTDPPTGRRLQEGTYITNEVDAVWGGIVTQEDQPILLGPIPEEWKPVLDLHRSVFEGGLSYMRPGVTFAELIDYTNEFGSERGMQTRILMSGRGVGDDGPLITPRIKGEHIRDLRLARGNVFVWKPYAMSADGRISFTTGGAAVVTDRGAELLVPRQHGMVSNV